MLLGMQTLKKQDWTEFSWRNNVNDAKLNVIIRLDNAYPIA